MTQELGATLRTLAHQARQFAGRMERTETGWAIRVCQLGEPPSVMEHARRLEELARDLRPAHEAYREQCRPQATVVLDRKGAAWLLRRGAKFIERAIKNRETPSPAIITDMLAIADWLQDLEPCRSST